MPDLFFHIEADNGEHAIKALTTVPEVVVATFPLENIAETEPLIIQGRHRQGSFQVDPKSSTWREDAFEVLANQFEVLCQVDYEERRKRLLVLDSALNAYVTTASAPVKATIGANSDTLLV